jgi:hypothetical protein
MPWPGFSELSFGFSFLREFERQHAPGGSFPAAPDFISQNEEATKGYDVEIALKDSLRGSHLSLAEERHQKIAIN